MPRYQTLPHIWLISDERNDAVLETALGRLPRGSGFIYRHYHLTDTRRRERFCALERVARGFDHAVIMADNALKAAEWGADGVYGHPRALGQRRTGLLRFATAHTLHEIGLANRMGADAVLLSPVFATRSHPGGAVLGPLRFRLLARHSHAPVIALGGMCDVKASALHWNRWAAIDGLS